MKQAAEIIIVFGIPILAVVFYLIKFSYLEVAVYKMGLANTITLAFWFFQIFTIRLWGMSGLHALIFLYLGLIAPILSIGFCYYIWVNRKELVGYKFVLISSFFNIGILLILILGRALQL